MLSKRDLQPGPMQLFLCSSLSTRRHDMRNIFFPLKAGQAERAHAVAL